MLLFFFPYWASYCVSLTPERCIRETILCACNKPLRIPFCLWLSLTNKCLLAYETVRYSEVLKPGKSCRERSGVKKKEFAKMNVGKKPVGEDVAARTVNKVFVVDMERRKELVVEDVWKGLKFKGGRLTSRTHCAQAQGGCVKCSKQFHSARRLGSCSRWRAGTTHPSPSKKRGGQAEDERKRFP